MTSVLRTIRDLVECIVIPLRLVYERVYGEQKKQG